MLVKSEGVIFSVPWKTYNFSSPLWHLGPTFGYKEALFLFYFQEILPHCLCIEFNILSSAMKKACVTEMAQWPSEIHALFLWHGIVARSSCPAGDYSSQNPHPHPNPSRWLVLASRVWELLHGQIRGYGFPVVSFFICQLNGGNTGTLGKSKVTG